jgi:hypothetical protein
MVIDQDFPMTRQQMRVMAVGLAVMAAVGIALFGGFIPGLKPNFSQPTVDAVDGHLYYVEPTLLHYPALGNTSQPWNVTFHNVTFVLEVTGWYYLTGGIVAGTGTEPNGTHYSFALGEFPNGSRPTLYISPDHAFGVDWTGGWLGPVAALLLVEVPPSTPSVT